MTQPTKVDRDLLRNRVHAEPIRWADSSIPDGIALNGYGQFEVKLTQDEAIALHALISAPESDGIDIANIRIGRLWVTLGPATAWRHGDVFVWIYAKSMCCTFTVSREHILKCLRREILAARDGPA